MTFKLAVVEDFDRKMPEKFDENANEKLSTKSPKTKKISTTFALINLMKGMVGPGCFALPMAFKQAGLWAAFGIDFLLGIVSAICMIKLVKCAQYLCERNKCGKLDYGQLAQEAFATGWRPLARFRYVARWFVNSCLIFLQLGICSVFYIFVVDHAKEVENGLTRDDYFLFALPAFLLISLVRSIHILSYVSLFGNVLMTTCLAIILYELTSAEHIPTSKLPAVTDFNGVVLSAGSILYALEGQAMVLPLENKMKHPKDMGGLTGVLVTGVSLVTLIYAGTGFYGYITYGDSVEASITLNLSNSPLNISVKVMLLCVVYSGFLIQQYPLVEMLWPLAKRPLRERGVRRAYIITLEYGFRYSIVFIALGLSWLIPNLEEIIPLVGVTSGMLLALVLPSVIEIVVFFKEWRTNHSTLKFCILLGLDCFYAALGLFFVVTGLQANIQDLIHGIPD
ncbi:hypothetical protein Y032_0114g418 [Ancylostoma ceylanicum]|uniref:Amino acid transporter transmembrane domain-containing protein n=1 Tax=Ancylostoma ceylanicum TaxID=53326 RepID=A0A016TD57_9BILA|nr:hypothetical protein Y032_0114g418 [Ancylostoma ceylanicum]